MNADGDSMARLCAASLALRRMVPGASSHSPAFVVLDATGEILSNAPSPSLCIESWLEAEDEARRHRQLAATGIVRESPRNPLLALAEAHARQREPLFLCCPEVNDATPASSSDASVFSAVSIASPSSFVGPGKLLRWFRSPMSNRLQPWISPCPPAAGARVPQTLAVPLPPNLYDDVAALRHSTLRQLERLLNKLLGAYTLAHKDRGASGEPDPPATSPPLVAASAFVRLESGGASRASLGRDTTVLVDIFSVWQRFGGTSEGGSCANASQITAADQLPRDVWKAKRQRQQPRRREALFDWTSDETGNTAPPHRGEVIQQGDQPSECIFRHRMELRLSLDLRRGSRSMDLRHDCGVQIRSGSFQQHNSASAGTSPRVGETAAKGLTRGVLTTSFVATERRAELVPLVFLDRTSVRVQQHHRSSQQQQQQQHSAAVATEPSLTTFSDGGLGGGRSDASGTAASSDAVGSMPVRAVALHLLNEMRAMELHMVQLFEDVAVPRLLSWCSPAPRASVSAGPRHGGGTVDAQKRGVAAGDRYRDRESESEMRKELLDYVHVAALRRESEKPPTTGASSAAVAAAAAAGGGGTGAKHATTVFASV